MKLSGWQRIGIVLSALWAIGASWVVRSDQVKVAHQLFESRANTCASKTGAFVQCLEAESWQSALDDTANWVDVAFVAIGPVVVVWLLVFLSARIIKWIAVGFKT
jgi:hypothetical protein